MPDDKNDSTESDSDSDSDSEFDNIDFSSLNVKWSTATVLDSTAALGRTTVLAERSLQNTEKVLGGIPPVDYGLYTAVGAEGMPRWPYTEFFGETQPATLQNVKIDFETSNGTKRLRLGGERNWEGFRCYGLAAGDHFAGYYSTVPELRKEIRKNDKVPEGIKSPIEETLDGVLTDWSGGGRPQEGKYETFYSVTQEFARWIKCSELQHVSDHELAYRLSWKAMSTAIGNIGGVDGSDLEGERKLLARLTDDAIRREARYLIPQRPEFVAEWASRLGSVYRELTEMSKKRDTEKWHTPKKAVAEWSMKKIYIKLTPGDNDTPSSEVIDPHDLKSVFPFDSFADYVKSMDPTPPFLKGDKVCLVDKSLEYSEMDLYKKVDGEVVDTDGKFVERLRDLPGIVQSVSGNRNVWITMDPVGTAYENWNNVYVLVSAAKLKKTPGE